MEHIFNNYKKLLAEFVGYKSISTDKKYLDEINKTVLWLKKLLEKDKFEVKIFKGKRTNPVIFASYVSDSLFPTLLIYGHYDVQPADKNDGWSVNPFTLSESKSKLIGRGAVDNKGQILAHIVSAFNLIETGKLKYNLKFLLEGNEETGNDELASIMKRHKKELSCDIVMVSDGELTNNKPTLEISLRGGFNCTLTLRTAKSNLHSGIFGGAIPNASMELVKFLSKLINPDNSVNYKEFYKGADKISKEQAVNNKKLTREAGDFTRLAGVKELLGKKGLDFYTLTGLTPTIQITGIKTGYIDDGYANIVPSSSEVRLNFRLVASQVSKEIARSFEIYVKENVPKFVDFKLEFTGYHNPIKVDVDNPYAKTAEEILENVYGAKVNRKNVGGAIPFVGDVKSILGVDTLLVPFVNEDCSMHGTDENFDIELVKKAILFSQEFMSYSPRFYHPTWKGRPNVVKRKT